MQPPGSSSEHTPKISPTESGKPKAKRKVPGFLRRLPPIAERIPVLGGLHRNTWLIVAVVSLLGFLAGTYWAPTTPPNLAEPSRLSIKWWMTALEFHRELQLASIGDEELGAVAVVRLASRKDRIFVGGTQGFLAFSDDQSRSWTPIHFDPQTGGYAVPGKRSPFPDVSMSATKPDKTAPVSDSVTAVSGAAPVRPKYAPWRVSAICRLQNGSLVLLTGAEKGHAPGPAAISSDEGETWRSIASDQVGASGQEAQAGLNSLAKGNGSSPPVSRYSVYTSTPDGLDRVVGDTFVAGFPHDFWQLIPWTVTVSPTGNYWGIVNPLGPRESAGVLYRADRAGGKWVEVFRVRSVSLWDVAFSLDGATGFLVGANGTIWRWRADNPEWQPLTRNALHPQEHYPANANAQSPAQRTGPAQTESVSELTSQSYWRLPPPWAYFLLFVFVYALSSAILITAISGADTLADAAAIIEKPEELAQPASGVALISVSDRPLADTDSDLLGFRSIARGVAGFLRNAKTRLPVTLAINGAWGSGKSSLMNLISSELQTAGFRPVHFNAWHHQDDDNLLASMLQSVRSDATPSFFRRGGQSFLLRLGWIRLRRYYPRALVMIGVFAALWAAESWYDGKNYQNAPYLRQVLQGWNEELQPVLEQVTGKTDGKTAAAAAAPADAKPEPAPEQPGPHPNEKSPASNNKESSPPPASFFTTVVALLSALHSLLDGASETVGTKPLAALYFLARMFPKALGKLKAFQTEPASLLHSAAPGVSQKDIEAQTNFRMQFAKEFADVTEALGNNHRLVIFVDDLDRCRPSNVAEMMEAINYVTVSGDCAFILGLETEVVRAALGLSFSAMAQEVQSRRGPAVGPANQIYPESSPEARRTYREEFARRYIEKLINIDMKVPLFDAEKKRALLDLDEKKSVQSDPFDRARKISKFFKALEPVFLLLLVVAVGWSSGRLMVRAAEERARIHVLENAKQTGPNAPPSQAQPTPTAVGAKEPLASAQDTQTAANQSQAAPTFVPAPSNAVSIPNLVAGQRSLPAAVLENPPAAIVILVILIVIAELLSREPVPSAEDSDAFTRALSAWSGIAAYGLGTPRATKRFLNRLRFLAMRQHPPEIQLPGLERLFISAEEKKRAIEREDQLQAKLYGTKTISEPILVALASLEAYQQPPIENFAAQPQLNAQAVSNTLALLIQQVKNAFAQNDFSLGPFVVQLASISGLAGAEFPKFADEKARNEYFAEQAKVPEFASKIDAWGAAASNKLGSFVEPYLRLVGETQFT